MHNYSIYIVQMYKTYQQIMIYSYESNCDSLNDTCAIVV